MPSATTSATRKKTSTLTPMARRTRFMGSNQPRASRQSIDRHAGVDQAHGDVVGAEYLAFHRLEALVLIGEELQRMPEPHHLRHRGRQRRARRTRMVQVLRVEQDPL